MFYFLKATMPTEEMLEWITKIGLIISSTSAGLITYYYDGLVQTIGIFVFIGIPTGLIISTIIYNNRQKIWNELKPPI